MRFLPLFFLLAAPLHAQTRFEGTLTEVRNGFEEVAQIAGEAPDKLRVETPVALLIAGGEQTQIYNKRTRRLRVFSANLAKNWSRARDLLSGGPANFAFFDAKATLQTNAPVLWRDKTFFGGGGKTAFYAAYKTPRELYPARVEVSPTSRVEKNALGTEIFRAKIELQNDLPVSAQSGETTWKYDLKKRETPFDAAFFDAPTDALPEAGDAGVAPGEFDLAIEKWSGALDAKGALAALEALDSKASAPSLAAFEIALSVGDLERAEKALARLEKTEVDRAEVHTRRAVLLEAQRDWEGAGKAWENANNARADFSIGPLATQFWRSTGDIGTARTVWKIYMQPTIPLEVQIAGATNFALFAAPNEWKTRRDELTGNEESVRLARALLSLRLGEIPTENFTSEAAQIAWAQGLERAGEVEKARALWQTLEKSGDFGVSNQARLHGMILAAKAGDLGASLERFNALSANLTSEIERENLRRTFFEAWQKNFRRLNLGKALDARAGATKSTETDARLFAHYAEFYGGGEALSRALETGSSRYPKSAFWHAKTAETLLSQALALSLTDPVQAARRDRLFSQIFAALDAAIAAEPNQPFYKMQRVLVFAQRAANLGLSDAGRAISERNAAREAAEGLVKEMPNDPDALVCAAIALLAFDGENGARRALQLCRAALQTRPFDGDRRTLVFAARQTIWGASEKLGDLQTAQAQSEILVASAQSAGEAVRLMEQQFSLYERAGASQNAPALAAMLVRAANEKWEFEAQRSLLDALTQRALRSGARAEILPILRDNAQPAGTLAWANYAYWRLEAAKTALARPDAPASADAELERANRELKGAVTALMPLARSDDRVIAAQAAVFLAERAGLSPEEGVNYLKIALQHEPRALGLRLATLENLTGEALQTERQRLLSSVAFDTEGARQTVAQLFAHGEDASAFSLGQELYHHAQTSPDVSANDFQRVAFAFARIAFQKDPALAAPIYTGLADASWTPLDRAAALLAWRQKWIDAEKPNEAAKFDAALGALGLSVEELERAADFVADVEN